MSTSIHGKVKFHIIHSYTSLNKGSAAVVISTTKAIRKKIPNAEFTIESNCVGVDKKLYDAYDIKVVRKVVSSPAEAAVLFVKALLWKALLSLGLNASRFVELERLSIYYDSDVILDLVGDNLSVPLNTRDVHFRFERNILAIVGHGYIFFLCMLFKKPIVIYAQTIGPLGIMRPFVKMLLNRMSLITVREEHSLEYLTKIGVNRPQIHLTADPAFLLSTLSDDEIDKILQREGIDPKTSIIGICVSSETAKYHYQGGEQKMVELFATIADKLVNKYDTQVVFVSFSTWKGHGGDERSICRKICTLVKQKGKINYIKGEYNPIELKGIISKCKLFIGSRGHSCILALSSCVPTIAIGHNPKYHGIMKMVNQERYVCKVHEFTYDRLISLVHHLWSNQEKERRELKSKVKLMRRLAILNAELVKEMLQERNVID